MAELYFVAIVGMIVGILIGCALSYAASDDTETLAVAIVDDETELKMFEFMTK